jgi:hypothetical protein
MQPHTRHRAGIAALAVVTLAACSSGGGDHPGSCSRAQEPTTGPGDVDLYFPADVGRSWLYSASVTQYGMPTSYQITVAVTGTQPSGTETASIFTATNTQSYSATSQLIVKRPWGVYELSDGSATPPLDQLYPSLVLPFPIVDRGPTLLMQCSNATTVDLDGDGKADHVDLVANLSVHTGETADVGAGHFDGLVNVQIDAQITAHGSSLGTLVVTDTKNEWYAAGVGRVVIGEQLSAGGQSETLSAGLLSYFVPTAGTPPSQALAVAKESPIRADQPPSFREAGVKLARELVHLASSASVP